MKYLLSALALFFTLGIAQAHTHLKASMPAVESVIICGVLMATAVMTTVFSPE